MVSRDRGLWLANQLTGWLKAGPADPMFPEIWHARREGVEGPEQEREFDESLALCVKLNGPGRTYDLVQEVFTKEAPGFALPKRVAVSTPLSPLTWTGFKTAEAHQAASQTCGTCRWGTHPQPGRVECHRFPPGPVGWLAVLATETCGEWKGRDGTP